MKRSRISMKVKASAEEAELSILGPIGQPWFFDEVSLQMVLDALDQAKDAPRIRLLLNSPGGDLFEAMAIYNALAKFREKLTVEVLGLAASAASVIALAGRELVMGKGSYFMIHDPWAVTIGPAEEHEKTADLLRKMSGSLAELYAAHSDLTVDEVLVAMEAETWYTAAEAVEAGFASSTAEDTEIAAVSIDTIRFQYKHVPAGMGTTAASVDQEVPRTAKAFERFLREAGYSRSEATAVAARGAKALLPERESREEPDTAHSANSEIECLNENLMLRSRSIAANISIHGRIA